MFRQFRMRLTQWASGTDGVECRQQHQLHARSEQAKPGSTNELPGACLLFGEFHEWSDRSGSLEIKDFLENKAVPVGGIIATVGAIAGTAGLLALAAALAFLLALLFAFLAALRAKGDSRLGQTLDDLRSLLLDRSDPDERAAGVFIWQCIYYKLFKSQQDNLDYEAVSYAVMDQHNYLDRSCNVNVDSIEVFFDAADPMLIAYIDALIPFETGQEFQGKSFGGYASLRFMGSSRALLGMQRWPVTCAVEMAGLKDVQETKELIDFAISLALNNNSRHSPLGAAEPVNGSIRRGPVWKHSPRESWRATEVASCLEPHY